jgi:hypothetical protein
VPDPRERRKGTKTQREKRQEEAAVIKKDQRPQIGDSTKQHLFLAKYLDILLIKDDVTRIATGLNFAVDRACWTLTAATALQDKYDDRIYSHIVCLQLKKVGRRPASRSLTSHRFHGGPSMLKTDRLPDSL